MIYLLYIVLLVMAAIVFKVLASLCHQLGHAVPALLWGIDDVIIFVGSEHDQKNCKSWRRGRLLLYWRPNRLWVEGGVTKFQLATLAYRQQIIALAGGHLVILALLLLSVIIFVTAKPTNFWAILNAVALSVLLVELLYPSLKTNSEPDDAQADPYDYKRIKKLIRLKPNERLLLQAQMWDLRKEFSKSAATLLPWVERGDAPSWVYGSVVDLHNLAGEHAEAVAAARAKMQRFGANSDDYVWLAWLLERAAQPQEACLNLEKALRMNPRNTNALNNYGSFLSMNGRQEEAIPILERAIRINPNIANPHANLGYVKIKMGLLEEGMQDISRALVLDQENSGAFFSIAVYLQALGRHGEALPYLELAHALHPEFAFYRDALDEALIAAKGGHS